MPELPEVETTKKSLQPLLGQQVAAVHIFQPKLRWQMPDDLDKLIGYDLTKVERRAKYLILTFSPSSNQTQLQKTILNEAVNTTKPSKLIIHLGMSGSLQQFAKGSKKRKHDHLIIDFLSSASSNQADLSTASAVVSQLHYHDPRRFGAVLWYDDYATKLFDHLGIEPLDDKFTGTYLYNLINRLVSADKPVPTKRPITRSIKAVIMDQNIVVGVGNIYATESLFLSGIHPSTPANQLTLQQLDTLVGHTKTILKRSIELGGSTLKDFTVADGTTGYFQQTLHVYGKHKSPCPDCKTTIDKVVITGRASTFCPQCQPLPT